MIYENTINGLTVRTGDIICTHDGGAPILEGQFWRFIGNLVPGEVDHVAIYVGPKGRCVEAGPNGVITFNVENKVWDSVSMMEQRGDMIDTFYGVAYPTENRGLSESDEIRTRESVALYCIAQAEAGKPYNLNFFNSETEHAFYCSQLVYLAYLKNGINLNTNLGVPNLPGTSNIIFPQEIWNGCVNKKG